MLRFRFVYFIIFQCCLFNFIFSQSAISKNTTVVNGKKYYLHKVEKGQSLYGIAKIYNVDLNTLLVENPEAIDGIKTGQELKIPTEKSKEQTQPTLKDYENYVTHKVAKGETVYSICTKYRITEQQLNQLNPDVKLGLKENSTLKIKEKEKGKITNTNSASQKNNTTTVKINSDTVAPLVIINKPKKSKYIVGLFLPFHFDEADVLNIDELIINKQNFPLTQQLAIDFYEGLKQAADSLKTESFEVAFKLYDSGEKDSLSVLKLSKTDEFKNLDLIIGPLYNSPFKIISGEAKKHQIPCVSPLTQQNKVLFDNVFTSKITPTNSTLLEGLANFCVDSLHKQNVVLVNSALAKDIPVIKSFKSYYNQKTKDTLTEVVGVAGAKAVYKADKANYYIVLSEGEAFVANFLTQLNIFADKKENIQVIGLRKWPSYDNLDLEYLNRFNFTYAASYFITDENTFTKKLSNVYKQKYNADADDYYYLAADIGLYYFNLLKTMGSSFSTVLDDLPEKGTSVNFDFIHPNNSTGFENQSVQIIRYTDYKLKKVN